VDNRLELIKKIGEFRDRARLLKITLTGADLNLSKGSDSCADCGENRLPCQCFGDLPRPTISFDQATKKIHILFKSSWDLESRDSFLADFKARASKILNKINRS